jgi:hypothetical protein
MQEADMQRAVTELFNRYARETNKALVGEPDLSALVELYTDSFIGSSPLGVMTGQQGDEFTKALTAGFARYRAIGTRRMTILDVRVEPIDTIHALANVAWRASYSRDGAQKEIDFNNVYLVRIDDGRAKVFGWITGDEDAELRKHGVIA